MVDDEGVLVLDAECADDEPDEVQIQHDETLQHIEVDDDEVDILVEVLIVESDETDASEYSY